MLPEHARSALLKNLRTMGAFSLCRASARQENAPIYNRAVFIFYDVSASAGYLCARTHTRDHPHALAYRQTRRGTRAGARAHTRPAQRRMGRRLAHAHKQTRTDAETAHGHTRTHAQIVRRTCTDANTQTYTRRHADMHRRRYADAQKRRRSHLRAILRVACCTSRVSSHRTAPYHVSRCVASRRTSRRLASRRVASRDAALRVARRVSICASRRATRSVSRRVVSCGVASDRVACRVLPRRASGQLSAAHRNAA